MTGYLNKSLSVRVKQVDKIFSEIIEDFMSTVTNMWY